MNSHVGEPRIGVGIDTQVGKAEHDCLPMLCRGEESRPCC
jgi:hypothetical protein